MKCLNKTLRRMCERPFFKFSRSYIDFESSNQLDEYNKKGSYEEMECRKIDLREKKNLRQTLTIPDDELDISYCRSSGPGGQHVNRTESKVVLRFNVKASKIINEPTRKAIFNSNRSRINSDGFLILTNQETREQPKNKARALSNLKNLIIENLSEEVVVKRKLKEEDPISKERRLTEKKRKSEIKRNRRGIEW